MSDEQFFLRGLMLFLTGMLIIVFGNKYAEQVQKKFERGVFPGGLPVFVAIYLAGVPLAFAGGWMMFLVLCFAPGGNVCNEFWLYIAG